jgi:hypothetical protein
MLVYQITYLILFCDRSNTPAVGESDLQKAIQMSMQTASTGANGSMTGFSEEDIAVQKAIEASKNANPVIDLTGDGAAGFAGVRFLI